MIRWLWWTSLQPAKGGDPTVNLSALWSCHSSGSYGLCGACSVSWAPQCYRGSPKSPVRPQSPSIGQEWTGPCHRWLPTNIKGKVNSGVFHYGLSNGIIHVQTDWSGLECQVKISLICVLVAIYYISIYKLEMWSSTETYQSKSYLFFKWLHRLIG